MAVEQKDSSLSSWQCIANFKKCGICLTNTQFQRENYTTVITDHADPSLEDVTLITLPKTDAAGITAQMRQSISPHEHATAACGHFAENLKNDLAYQRGQSGGWWGLLAVGLMIAVIIAGVRNSSWLAASGAIIAAVGVLFLLRRLYLRHQWIQFLRPQVDRFTAVFQNADRHMLLKAFRDKLRPRNFVEWLSETWGTQQRPSPIGLFSLSMVLVGGTVWLTHDFVQTEYEWLSARYKETETVYEEFLAKYPKDSQAARAQKNLDDLRYQKVEQSTDPLQLKQFLTQYPGNQHASEARERAWSLVLNKAQTVNRVSAWMDLLEHFPDHPQQATARTAVHGLLASEMETKPDANLLRRFLKLMPAAEQASWAMKRLDQLDLETLTHRWSRLMQPDTASTNLAAAIVRAMAVTLREHKSREIILRFDMAFTDKAELASASGLAPGRMPDMERLVNPSTQKDQMVAQLSDFLARACDQCGFQVRVQPLLDKPKVSTPAKSQVDAPTRVRVRHIFLRVPPDAPENLRTTKRELIDSIAKRLKGGEDFADLAAQFSEDPATKERGGDLGFLGRGSMVPEFENAAFGLELNHVSSVVETKFGFHILHVLEQDFEKPREERTPRFSLDINVPSVTDEARPTLFIVCGIMPSGAVYKEKRHQNQFGGIALPYWIHFRYGGIAFTQKDLLQPDDLVSISRRINVHPSQVMRDPAGNPMAIISGPITDPVRDFYNKVAPGLAAEFRSEFARMLELPEN